MTGRRASRDRDGACPPGLPVVFLIGLLAVPVASSAPEGEAGVFLSAVEGAWQGRAVHTPAGPFSYDIEFAADAAGCSAGVAEPGGVHHRWKFCPAGDRLELEFLSDFGGNDRPMLLPLEGVDAGTLVFHSQTLDFLKVLARIEQDCLRLQVLHHDRLHVEIHLRRASTGAGQGGAGACAWPVPVSESL
jgi:hypothetical protein